MKRSTVVLALLVLAPLARAEDEEIGIAVLDFDSKGGISQQQMEALSDMLANEIRGRGKFRVIGKNDIRATLNLAERKAQLGCSDDACIAEIGGALGVRWIVVGNISLFGTTYLLNLKLLDVENVKVAWSSSQKISGGQDKLLDALSAAAADMVGKVFSSAGKPPAAGGGAKPPAAQPQGSGSAAASTAAGGEPRPAPTPRQPVTAPQQPVPVVIVGQAGPPKKKTTALELWGKVLCWTGGAAITFGAAATVVSWYKARTYNDVTADPDARFAARDDSRSWARMMWIGYGTGAALLTAGILMRLFAPEEYEPAVTPTLVPAAGGATLGIGGRW